jgi:hypothetical protein
VGGWSHGNAQGTDKIFRRDGSQIIGNWKDGRLQRAGARERDANGHEHAIEVGRGSGNGGEMGVGETVEMKTKI